MIQQEYKIIKSDREQLRKALETLKNALADNMRHGTICPLCDIDLAHSTGHHKNCELLLAIVALNTADVRDTIIAQ